MAPYRGGPAFPLLEQRTLNGDLSQEAHPGMSLRDYFAGQVIVACADWEDEEEAARYAYRVADALLVVRDAQVQVRPPKKRRPPPTAVPTGGC